MMPASWLVFCGNSLPIPAIWNKRNCAHKMLGMRAHHMPLNSERIAPHSKRRDRHVKAALRKDDWKILVVWTCELKEPDRLRTRLASFLAIPTDIHRRDPPA